MFHLIVILIKLSSLEQCAGIDTPGKINDPGGYYEPYHPAVKAKLSQQMTRVELFSFFEKQSPNCPSHVKEDCWITYEKEGGMAWDQSEHFLSFIQILDKAYTPPSNNARGLKISRSQGITSNILEGLIAVEEIKTVMMQYFGKSEESKFTLPNEIDLFNLLALSIRYIGKSPDFSKLLTNNFCENTHNIANDCLPKIISNISTKGQYIINKLLQFDQLVSPVTLVPYIVNNPGLTLYLIKRYEEKPDTWNLIYNHIQRQTAEKEPDETLLAVLNDLAASLVQLKVVRKSNITLEEKNKDQLSLNFVSLNGDNSRRFLHPPLLDKIIGKPELTNAERVWFKENNHVFRNLLKSTHWESLINLGYQPDSGDYVAFFETLLSESAIIEPGKVAWRKNFDSDKILKMYNLLNSSTYSAETRNSLYVRLLLSLLEKDASRTNGFQVGSLLIYNLLNNADNIIFFREAISFMWTMSAENKKSISPKVLEKLKNSNKETFKEITYKYLANMGYRNNSLDTVSGGFRFYISTIGTAAEQTFFETITYTFLQHQLYDLLRPFHKMLDGQMTAAQPFQSPQDKIEIHSKEDLKKVTGPLLATHINKYENTHAISAHHLTMLFAHILKQQNSDDIKKIRLCLNNSNFSFFQYLNATPFIQTQFSDLYKSSVRSSPAAILIPEPILEVPVTTLLTAKLISYKEHEALKLMADHFSALTEENEPAEQFFTTLLLARDFETPLGNLLSNITDPRAQNIIHLFSHYLKIIQNEELKKKLIKPNEEVTAKYLNLMSPVTQTQ